VANPRRSGRSRLTLALLVLTSVTLLTLDFRDFGPLQSVRDGIAGALEPVSDTAGGAIEPFDDAWNGAWNYGELEEENLRLKERIDELEGQAERGEIAEQALRDLTGELDIPWAGDREKATARVVSGPIGNFDHTVEIDKGSGAGIKAGMAVTTSRGLIGRVVRVTGGRSVVQLITDPAVSLGIRLVDTGAIGVATGEGDGRPLVAENIDKDTPVEDGALVATSGLARSLFPDGIPVGRVVAVQDNTDDTAQTVRIEPLADLDDLGFVTVVLEEPPE
jgi:rod shape-determining protein MreC